MEGRRFAIILMVLAILIVGLIFATRPPIPQGNVAPLMTFATEGLSLVESFVPGIEVNASRFGETLSIRTEPVGGFQGCLPLEKSCQGAFFETILKANKSLKGIFFTPVSHNFLEKVDKGLNKSVTAEIILPKECEHDLGNYSNLKIMFADVANASSISFILVVDNGTEVSGMMYDEENVRYFIISYDEKNIMLFEKLFEEYRAKASAR